MLRKELKALAGKTPRGVTRLFIGDEVWDYRAGDTSLACHNPLTGESFGFAIGDLDLSNPVAVKKAILRRSAELKLIKPETQPAKEVMPTLNLFTT